MKIVCVPDSFKGSATATEVAAALARGAQWACPEARVEQLPFADGGEGTLASLCAAWATPLRQTATVDALGRPRLAQWALSTDAARAVIECAEAIGLPAVHDLPPRPLDADSFGVGVLVRAALDAGAQEIVLTLGGTATTDGGAGMLRALGARLLDATGAPVAPGGRGLADIAHLDLSELDPRVRAVRWSLAVDVDNPLTGPAGAAAVFAPQKGAQPDDVALLDAALTHWAHLLAAASGRQLDVAAPGLGAAGGIPSALVALCGAELLPGGRLVAQALDLTGRLAGADLVLTGEGRLDSQSLAGKVVQTVRHHAPRDAAVVVIAGAVQLTATEVRQAGLTAALSICRGPATLESLKVDALDLISAAASNACALFAAGFGART